MKKITATVLFLLVLLVAQSLTTNVDAAAFKTGIQKAADDRVNKEQAKPFEIYSIPEVLQDSKSHNFSYRVVVPSEYPIRIGERLTTQTTLQPVKAPHIFRVIWTDKDRNNATLLLESGPDREVPLFTQLVPLEF